MLSQKINEKVGRMSALVSEMQTYNMYKVKLEGIPRKGKKEEETITKYKDYIDSLIEQFMVLNSSLIQEVGGPVSLEVPSPVSAPSPKPKKEKIEFLKKEKKEKKLIHGKYLGVSGKERKQMLLDINLTKKQVKDFVKSKTKKKEKFIEKEKFTIYKINPFGKFANLFFAKLTVSLIKKYPKFFEGLYSSLRSADIKILSRTYISIVLLSTAISFFVITLGFFTYGFLFGTLSILTALVYLAYGIFGSIAVFVFGYLYPNSVMSQKKGNIKRDIPFAVIHMSAVAGSGANPIAMFDLLLKSKDYPGLESEIRKVVNYVNLFGYDLPTAMRNVAKTTPSPQMKSLLNGIVSNTESGGSLKDYLKEKTEDVLNIYRLERKKYVAAMSTYSDIYTGLLIAAPLLFFTTLAIINMLGGSIGGVSVSMIATVGTFGVIPALNIMYIFFITLMEPK